jgi:hypothetical protein
MSLGMFFTEEGDYGIHRELMRFKSRKDRASEELRRTQFGYLLHAAEEGKENEEGEEKRKEEE